MNKSKTIERVNEILANMTLEEKVAQMMQISYCSNSREVFLFNWIDVPQRRMA